jgi:MFS transporter, DHA2 family, multidrug resistance protein
MFMFGFMILGSTYLVPAYAQALMGYRATEAGEIIAPGGILLILLFPVIGRLVDKVDLRLIIGLGVMACSGALWWMTNLYLQVSFDTLALGRIMQAVGLSLLFLPINAVAFRDIPQGHANYASALINLARNFGGSVGISLASTLVTRRSQFHQSRLVEHLQSLNPAYPAYVTQMSHATQTTPGGMASLAQSYSLGTTQASLLSYLDAFKAFAVLFLLLLPLLFFLRPGTAGAKGGGGA